MRLLRDINKKRNNYFHSVSNKGSVEIFILEYLLISLYKFILKLIVDLIISKLFTFFTNLYDSLDSFRI